MGSEQALSHRTAAVGGVQLHYVTAGSGPPVVLLHGWPETWYAWRKVIPALAERHTVVAPDLRGLGESSRPAGGYDKKTVAEDVHALMLQLSLGPAALVSADMGGPVAYWLAMAHPEAVSRFVFIESGIPGFGLEAVMDVTHGGSWHWGFFMAPGYPELLLPGREREFLTRFAYRDSAYVKDAITEADIDEYVRHYEGEENLRAALAYYRTVHEDARDNERWRGRKLAMPVLAIDGAHGFGTSIPTMQAVSDDVRTAVIPDAGHWVAEEQPERLVEQLRPFLGDARSVPAARLSETEQGRTTHG